MQSYVDITDDKTLTESRALLLANILTGISNSSGTAFPTANLQNGMFCYRTDQSKIYILKSQGPDVWQLLFDLSGADAKVPDTDKVDGETNMASIAFATDMATSLAIALG